MNQRIEATLRRGDRLARTSAVLLLVAHAAAAAAAAAPAQSAGAEPSFRFIGNSAFEITDGTITVLMDFPYRSGAHGYMAFPASELRARQRALCLFTHRHADHFEPSAVATVGCSVAGPREVMAAVPAERRMGDGPVWTFGGATIRCLATPHANVEHCSYVVDWGGRRWFVSGDVEDLAVLEGVEGPLDAVFLPSWLVSSSSLERARRLAAQVVVHHHSSGEEAADCPGCLVPDQGSTFSLVPDESPATRARSSRDQAAGDPAPP